MESGKVTVKREGRAHSAIHTVEDGMVHIQNTHRNAPRSTRRAFAKAITTRVATS